MRIQMHLIVLAVLVAFASCKKDEQETVTPTKNGKLALNITYKIDNASLTYDTIMYQNAAGNKYSVSRLFYYISGVKFYKADGTFNTCDEVIYVDAASSNHEITFSKAPLGTYTAISFLIGIDTAQNVSGSLPTTIENVNMAWPNEMGGGYHFLKLEGHYLDANLVERGYTVHLGTNAALVSHNKLTIPFIIDENQTTSFGMLMNINEWFTHSYNYNFNTDGNYTMGNNSLMQLISNNGKDVFSIN